mmetsp:Transcript_66339/g.213802  ORF Transcript_66339/g.213802 Transcript_66339/m.213802 type:complete len:246 (-) Transcript_66339:42-779(-)
MGCGSSESCRDSGSSSASGLLASSAGASRTGSGSAQAASSCEASCWRRSLRPNAVVSTAAMPSQASLTMLCLAAESTAHLTAEVPTLATSCARSAPSVTAAASSGCLRPRSAAVAALPGAAPAAWPATAAARAGAAAGSLEALGSFMLTCIRFMSSAANSSGGSHKVAVLLTTTSCTRLAPSARAAWAAAERPQDAAPVPWAVGPCPPAAAREAGSASAKRAARKSAPTVGCCIAERMLADGVVR